MAVIRSANPYERFAKRLCGQRQRTQGLPTDIFCRPTSSRIPGVACIVYMHHCCCFPRRSMSWQCPHLGLRRSLHCSTSVRALLAALVHCQADCTTSTTAAENGLLSSSVRENVRPGYLARCQQWRGAVVLTLPYSPAAWRMLYSGRLSLRSPSGELQALLSSTQLRCSFLTVSRSAPLRPIRRWSHAGHGGPDAICGGFAEASQPSQVLERFLTSALYAGSLSGCSRQVLRR